MGHGATILMTLAAYATPTIVYHLSAFLFYLAEFANGIVIGCK